MILAQNAEGDHGVGGGGISGSIIENVAFILGEVTDVGYDVQC